MSSIATATMISSAEDRNAPLLRTEFTLEAGHGPVVKAELQASAQGIFEAFLGGARVGDDVLSPAGPAMSGGLRYRRYDVTGCSTPMPTSPSCWDSRWAMAGTAGASPGAAAERCTAIGWA
jgi:alpha-L-rhamnosidase